MKSGEYIAEAASLRRGGDYLRRVVGDYAGRGCLSAVGESVQAYRYTSGDWRQVPKNEIIIQKAHRYSYDRAMYMCGAKIVQVVTLEDYKECVYAEYCDDEFFNAGDDALIRQKEWLEIAHQHGVPCHLDAAADMPPIENLWKYTGMGWDWVCFRVARGCAGRRMPGCCWVRSTLRILRMRITILMTGWGRGMKVAKEQSGRDGCGG